MNLARLLLLAALAALVCGCTTHRAASPDVLEQDLGRYRAAVRQYESGEVEPARERLKALAQSAADPAMRARAKVALASAAMAEARTPEELDAARLAWRDAMRDYGPERDAAMLAPLIDRFRLPATEADQSAQQPRIILAPPRKKCPEQDKLDAASDQLAECRKQRTAQDKRIKQLQDQMKALESIHKEILDKKKEMSAPK